MSIDPRELLPLPPHDFQVLLALLEAPRHAYGLTRAVDEDNGDVRLEIGSLYRILSRLTEEGLIEDVAPATAAASAGHESRRRYYRITPLGRKVAESEATRLTTVLRLARRRNLLPKGSR
ncbi:MAG: helix-turn-helix transcriptional regulator [Acidobacteria bacterium]|nr:helix-turn-helix transcriptional regulator [Acidobacteriota bacterium]